VQITNSIKDDVERWVEVPFHVTTV